MNPYEHRVRDWGLYVEGRLPVVLGNDIAGIVEKVGHGVTEDIHPGDHVFGQTNYLKGSSDQSGLQDYCLLDSYTVAKVPASLTDDDGASLVCNIVAPFWAVFGAQGLDLPFPFDNTAEPTAASSFDYSKEIILIIGAGSNCGKYAVQICALAGFGTIIATASLPKNETDLRSFGATHVIDRHAPDLAARIHAIVGDSLAYAFDAVNVDHTLGISLLSSSQGGTLACIVPGPPVAEESASSGKKQAKFTQGQSHNQPELGRNFWKYLPRWMEAGRIKSTGWDVLEGRGLEVNREKINQVLDTYRDGGVPPRQVHVHL